MPIDYVIPFVDGSDAAWQAVYNRYDPVDKRESRSRDWDVLRYELRSIEKFMPWINKVYIILSVGESQIPDWLRTENDKVKIVWDWEIVPECYLPTFNSNTIDLFVPMIEELSEHYLYACDDYIITKPRKESDFFTEDGKVRLKLERYRFERNTYSRTVVNSVKMFGYELVDRYAKGGKNYYKTIYANHTITPHLRSVNLRFLEQHRREIENSLSVFREPKNLTWLIYCLNVKRMGLMEQGDIKVKLIQMKQEEDIAKVTFDDCDVIVLNDAFTGDFKKAKDDLIKKMEAFLPMPCEFERP